MVPRIATEMGQQRADFPRRSNSTMSHVKSSSGLKSLMLSGTHAWLDKRSCVLWALLTVPLSPLPPLSVWTLGIDMSDA